MEKQIEEMARDLTEIFNEEYEKRYLITPTNTATKLTEQGYRKQVQGEWINVATGFICSVCKTHEARMTKFCPNCGAKMKGAEQ